MPTEILRKDTARDLKHMWVVFNSTIKTHVICFQYLVVILGV